MLTTPTSGPTERERYCILVLGMHRSGTSVLARIINLLGAALPRHVLGADCYNETGHWEPERLIRVHDELLADAGSSWQDWQPFDTQALTPDRIAHHLAQIRGLISDEYGDQPMFVLKDPRICRIVPLYLDVFAEMRVVVRPVLLFRNPLEVAASLAARNGISKADATLLWLSSTLQAESTTRGLRRVIVEYDQLLADAVGTLTDWDQRLGVVWPVPFAAVATLITDVVLRRDLRHHSIHRDNVCLDLVTAGWAWDVFSAFRLLAIDHADVPARHTLDRVAREFAAAMPFLAAREAAAKAEVHFLRDEAAKWKAAAAPTISERGGTSSESELAKRFEELKTAQDSRTAEISTTLLALQSSLNARNATVLALNQLIVEERARSQLLRRQYDAIGRSGRQLAVSRRTPSHGRLPQAIKRVIDWMIRKRAQLRFNRQRRVIERSGRFDKAYYLHHNPDVATSGLDPIQHYLMHGAREGRNPSPLFDTNTYLKQYPNAIREQDNPLLHAIRMGHYRTQTRTVTATPVVWPRPKPHDLCNVSIILPIFNGRSHLERLLPSLMQNTCREAELLLLDDASTDVTIGALFAPILHAMPRARYLRNDKNQGFLRTVNDGAARAGGHFILLNTDTEVPPGWVERLMAPIFADPGIASATPFSNAATIFSFPRANEDNDPVAGLTVNEIDRAFRCMPAQQWPASGDLQVPTGVGFCMAINGDAWRRLGGFDSEAFGRGYGEENDWCQRALAHGYRHVLVPNLYVHHEHGGSFSAAEKQQLAARNTAVLNERWPRYEAQVRDHISRDPWRELRLRALERLCLNSRPMIIVDHGLGGGANLYRHLLVQRAERANQPVVTLTYDNGQKAFLGQYRLGSAESTRFAVRLEDAIPPSELAAGCLVVYNNAVGWPAPLEAVTFLRSLVEQAGTESQLLVHDYYSVCPSYTLLNDASAFCGVPSNEAECGRCLPVNPHAHVHADIPQWRKTWGRLLEAVDEVVCFSESSRKIMVRAYPAIADRIIVRPHEPATTITRPAKILQGGPLTVGVIGSINAAKGARVVMSLCEYLVKEVPTARVVVIGEMDPAEKRSFNNLTILGRYDAAELVGLVERHGVNACLLPSICPETFSYVTQEIMAMELPLVCFALGAPPERVRHYPYGVVIELSPAADIFHALEQARRSRFSG